MHESNFKLPFKGQKIFYFIYWNAYGQQNSKAHT
jgi:hypothetical protein